MLIFSYILGWLAFSILSGAIANSRGRNPWVWACLAAIFSSLLIIPLLFLLDNLKMLKNETEGLEKYEQQQRAERELIKKKNNEQKEQEDYNKNKISGIEFAAAIEKLHQMRSRKLLSDKEFEEKKQRNILGLNSKYLAEKPDDFLFSLLPVFESGMINQDEITQIKQIVNKHTRIPEANDTVDKAAKNHLSAEMDGFVKILEPRWIQKKDWDALV